MNVFILFLLALITGILSTLFWIPEKDLGRGYFQLNALIVLGLLALVVAVVLLHPIEPFAPPSTLGMALLWIAVWRRLPLLRSGLGRVLAFGSRITGRAGPDRRHRNPPIERQQLDRGPDSPPLSPDSHDLESLVSSAFLLGWSLATMLLGHWYLISPKLSFRHLITFCRVLLRPLFCVRS